MADSNGDEADGSDETGDAAGEAVVEGIVVDSSGDTDDDNACDNADDGEACDNADDVEACDDADNGDDFDVADGGFDGNGYVGAVRDSVDGSGSADDASESTRNHTVEGANLIMQLKEWEIKELRMRIWRMTSYVKQLKKVNYGIVVGLKVAQSELRRLWKAECDVQRNKSTTVFQNIYSLFVYISAYANVYFKTTITKSNIKIILIAGVPSSQALPGFLITAPPSVCVLAVLVALAVWIRNQKKQEQIADVQRSGHRKIRNSSEQAS